MKNIIHVPHDGHQFPTDLCSSICIPLEDFETYHKAMSDWEVYNLIPLEFRARTIRFPFSRLFCDVERFLEGEEMEVYGMGFCYERAYDGKQIKYVDDAVKARTLTYYHQHHEKLKALVQSSAEDVAILDLHSFSDQIIPSRNRKDGKVIPDICLGLGDEIFATYLYESFSKADFSVEFDYPYAGSLLPNLDPWWTAKHTCRSVMVEIHKRVYLENKRTAELISAVLSDYLSYVQNL